jgi:hypothetical protein
MRGDYKWYEINEALNLIIKCEKGYVEDLLECFVNELSFVDSIDSAQDLLDTLYLLGYISIGVNKSGQSTWRIRRKTYEEVLPFWKKLIKRFFKLLGGHNHEKSFCS